MKELTLKSGHVVLLDDLDYERIAMYGWQAVKGTNTYYARHEISIGPRGARKRISIAMHHMILAPKIGFEIDHVNRNGLDNRRENLRYATRSQNIANSSLSSRSTSGTKGIGIYKSSKKQPRWRSHIRFNGKLKALGYFDTKEEAAAAYSTAAKERFGEFATIHDGSKSN